MDTQRGGGLKECTRGGRGEERKNNCGSNRGTAEAKVRLMCSGYESVKEMSRGGAGEGGDEPQQHRSFRTDLSPRGFNTLQQPNYCLN